MPDDFRESKNKKIGKAEESLVNSEEADMPETEFKPPDEAEKDVAIAPETAAAERPNLKKPRMFKLPKALAKLSRKQIIILAVALGLIIAGSTIWWFALRKKPAPPKPVAKQEVKKEAPKPTTTAARLSGVQVPIEQDKLPVTGVMIENSPDARPQSGLKDAGVVYEAIAEGGITRFLALFQTEQPDYIGPVRSVRPYYLDFLAPYDAGIAHAGGSGEALEQVRSGAFKDMDQFFNPDYYHRVSSRYAPHNLYTSRAELLDMQNKKGWGTSKFNGFVRKAEKVSPTPTAHTMDFAISGFLYNPHYDYNPATNSYNRSEGGQPHTDERSGAQLSPKVVIAVVMPHSYAGIYSVYQTSGNGKAYIFQDGTATEGTWEKADRNAQIRFGDANGAPLGLDPGQTWITLVSSPGDVSYKL